MIDIHSHVIFGVDDGAATIEESLDLLRASYAQGVRAVVATSHRRKGMFDCPEEIIYSHFKQLQARLSEVAEDFLLFYGAELYVTDEVIAGLEQGLLPTYAGGKGVLVEFSGRTPYKTIHTALVALIGLGLTPVIAHIERYDALAEDRSRLEELIALGCYTQVNSVHVLKAKLFGDPDKVYKQRVQHYLEQDLVHFVASDMHSLDQRPSYMRMAYDHIAATYGHKRAEDLFVHNPLALLHNQL